MYLAFVAEKRQRLCAQVPQSVEKVLESESDFGPEVSVQVVRVGVQSPKFSNLGVKVPRKNKDSTSLQVPASYYPSLTSSHVICCNKIVVTL